MYKFNLHSNFLFQEKRYERVIINYSTNEPATFTYVEYLIPDV